MATADRILQLKLVSDVTSAQKGMKTMTKDMSKVQKAQTKVSSGFKSIGGAILALGAVSIATDIIGQGIEDFFAGEKAARDFERQIAGTSKNVAADMERMNRAMQEALNVGIDDDQFQTVTTGIMRRLRVDVPGAIRRAKVAFNLAAAGLFDTPEAAAKDLMKALEGNKKALDKLGVPMKARKNDATILAFLEKKYGDAVDDNLNTLPGKWDAIQVQFRDFVAKIVGDTIELAENFNKPIVETTGMGIGGWINSIGPLTGASMAALQVRLQAAGTVLGGAASVAGQAIATGISDPVGTLAGLVGAAMTAIQNKITGSQEGIRTASQGVADAIRQPIVNTLGVIDQRADDTLQHMISALDEMKARLGGARIPVIGGPIGRLPFFGEGGIVDRPTLAVIGESGPEAVIPLSGGIGGMGGITVVVNAGVGDPVEIGRQVDRVLRAYRGRAGLAA